MDAGGKVLKGDSLADHPPQVMRTFVQGNLVGIDIPRPQCDAGRIGSDP